MMRTAFFLLFLTCLLNAAPSAFPGKWHAEQNGRSLEFKSGDGILSSQVRFPGGVLLFKEQNRCTFRPDEAMFSAAELEFEIRASNITSPLKAWIFVKDKDGAWFQTDREFALQPGQWTRLSVRLDVPGKNLLPMGHRAAWNGFYASKMFAVGLSIYSDDMQQADFEWREPVFSGKRKNELPSIRNWRLPAKGTAYAITRSRFELDKEFFNPFDSDRIAVDFEFISPSKPDKVQSFPAFFTQDYQRKVHFTKETYSPAGLPCWEFRFIPKEPGVYKLRLSVMDFTVDSRYAYTVYSDWRTLEVAPSGSKGFIRVGKKNPRYFEYENGELFYPVGINIHSNTDQRSENGFGFGHQADRGNVDYEEYIRRCSSVGINLMEVWMGAWTYAIEWSSFRTGYYGLGVYHLGHAAKLDDLLDYALKHRMNISLVLDNHGKLADVCDPEWHDSPFNDTSIFAVSNSAFLKRPYEFWSNEKAIHYTKKRNRYIAARWGAYPNIFAMQLWSEVDLVGDSYRAREDKSIIKWHQQIANDIKRQTQGQYLTATHICGDIGNLMGWRALSIDPKEMDHVCCDAYRNRRIPIVNQLQKHQDQIMPIMKPVLVTEYGEPSRDMEKSTTAGDVHGGIWAALFTRHAGTPWLWWHDFIHINDLYAHFSGFSKFLTGLDPRQGNVTFGQMTVKYSQLPEPLPQPTIKFIRKLFRSKKQIFDLPESGFSGLFYNQNDTFLCGWIYNVGYLYELRKNPEEIPLSTQVGVSLKTPLKAGAYAVFYFDTMTNELVTSSLFLHKKAGNLNLSVPDIKLDLAFKLYRIGALP